MSYLFFKREKRTYLQGSNLLMFKPRFVAVCFMKTTATGHIFVSMGP